MREHLVSFILGSSQANVFSTKELCRLHLGLFSRNGTYWFCFQFAERRIQRVLPAPPRSSFDPRILGQYDRRNLAGLKPCKAHVHLSAETARQMFALG